MVKAVSIFATVCGMIGVMLCSVYFGWSWPELEVPPRQGEALDLAAWREGRYIHAASVGSRLIREPMNTWSNLAFVAVGSLLSATARLAVSRAVGWALTGVGVGSFLYHASASRTLRHVDVGAMYFLFLMMACLSAMVLVPRLRLRIEASVRGCTLAALVGALLLTGARNVAVWGFKPFSLSVATSLAAIALSLALLRSLAGTAGGYAAGRVLITLMLFGLALVCQLGDRPGAWLCAPGGWIQGHALWHVLSAGAVWLGVRSLDESDPIVRSVAVGSEPTRYW